MIVALILVIKCKNLINKIGEHVLDSLIIIIDRMYIRSIISIIIDILCQ